MLTEKIFGEKIQNVVYKERPSIYGIIIRNGEIGVIHINGKKGYFLPGGGKKEGETEIECLRREFIEETGFAINIGDYIDTVVEYSYCIQLNCYLKVIATFYFVDLGEKTKGKIEEDHNLVWVSPEIAINNMALTHHSWAIQKSLNILNCVLNK